MIKLLAVLVFALLGCASPQERAEEKALRTLTPIPQSAIRIPQSDKNPVRPMNRRDSDLLRALENLEPISGVIWSYPKPSLELVKAPPGTSWHDRELIFWIKETVNF